MLGTQILAGRGVLGHTYERLAVNEMGEDCMATPAISEGVLYVRGRRYLTAIGADE